MKLALIGHGAIAHQILAHVARAQGLKIVSILDVRDSTEPGGPKVTTQLEDLLATGPDLIIECAGHSAVNAYAAPILEAGYDLLIVSIGALSDTTLRDKVFLCWPRRSG